MRKYTTLFGLIALMALLLCAPAAAESVSGCAFMDVNLNGVCDSDEQLISGVPVALEKQTENGWKVSTQTATDVYGAYLLKTQEEGTFRVKCLLSGHELAASSVGGAALFEDGFAVSAPFSSASAFTGDVALTPAARVSVYAFRDSDGNGKIGKYERALADVLVEVMDGEHVLASGVSDKKGHISLTVVPGRWVLRFTVPAGFGLTQTGEDSLVGSADASSALSGAMEFIAGAEVKAGVGARPVGSFSGRAWEDMNNNGVMDEGEPGVAGVTVHLLGQRTGASRSFTTDESGEYHFDLLPDDKYTVTADLPEAMLYARYSQTGKDLRSIFTGSIVTREFNVKGASSVTNKNIGVVQKGAVYGTAFFDLNYNGLMDEGEPGYKGLTVEVFKISTGDSMGKFVTGEDGAFRIENLRGGDYRLRAILPDDGSIFSLALEGAANEVNLFSQRPGRRENSIQPLNITSGGEAGALIGVARGASVSGTVFEDADYNGRKNGKEKALSGLKVRIEDLEGNVIATDTTDKKGQYTLTGILPGEYVVKVQRRASYGFTRLRPEEADGSHITVLEGEYGVTAPMTIAMAETIKDVNAGMLPGATLSGAFFHDSNDNGLWDVGEGGMLSGKVRLLSSDGDIDLYQTPAEDGSYFFDGVMPGDYTLTYILPEHCEMARTAKDGNTVKHEGLETVTKSFRIKMGEAAVRPLAGAVTLGSFEGIVYRDANGSGTLDAGEERIAGAEVTLSGSGENSSSVSAADGSFSVTGLRPADYTLMIQLPDGLIFSSDLETIFLPNTASHAAACPWDLLTSRSEKHVGAVAPSSVSGVIWMDENQDGQRAGSEWIMEGVEVSLIDERTNLTVATVVSDKNGFRFDNVRPSEYTVIFRLPAQSTPAEDSASTFQLNGEVMTQSGLHVAEGAQVDSLTTGLVSRTSIGGSVWLDETGVRSPVPGVVVTLWQNGQPVQKVLSSQEGSYRFDGLWPGVYTLTADVPSGMIFVRPDDPNYASGATVIVNEDGASREITLLMAQHQLNLDVLCIKPAKVGDIAWLDENANGLVDGSEPRLSGVKVQLVQNGQPLYETSTDAYGYYRFADVYPGEYTLKASAFAALAPTKPVEALRIISSCLTSGDGLNASSDVFRVESGETNMNFDLGYILLNGQTLPAEAASPAPGRDWTLTNIKED